MPNAGTMILCHSDDRETVCARYARENGRRSLKIRMERGARESGRRSPGEVHHEALAWGECLNETILDTPGEPRLDRDEGPTLLTQQAGLRWLRRPYPTRFIHLPLPRGGGSLERVTACLDYRRP